MYMPGRLRTASSPSRTVMSLAPYESPLAFLSGNESLPVDTENPDFVELIPQRSGREASCHKNTSWHPRTELSFVPISLQIVEKACLETLRVDTEAECFGSLLPHLSAQPLHKRLLHQVQLLRP